MLYMGIALLVAVTDSSLVCFYPMSRPTLLEFGAVSWCHPVVSISIIRNSSIITLYLCYGSCGIGAELDLCDVTGTNWRDEVSGTNCSNT
jgi:hypothetical protein